MAISKNFVVVAQYDGGMPVYVFECTATFDSCTNFTLPFPNLGTHFGQGVAACGSNVVVGSPSGYALLYNFSSFPSFTQSSITGSGAFGYLVSLSNVGFLAVASDTDYYFYYCPFDNNCTQVADFPLNYGSSETSVNAPQTSFYEGFLPVIQNCSECDIQIVSCTSNGEPPALCTLLPGRAFLPVSETALTTTVLNANYLAVGMEGTPGYVYLYTWNSTFGITSPTPLQNFTGAGYFGDGVAWIGSTLLISAPYSGVVYAFDCTPLPDSSSPCQSAPITNLSNPFGGRFGNPFANTDSPFFVVDTLFTGYGGFVSYQGGCLAGNYSNTTFTTFALPGSNLTGACLSPFIQVGSVAPIGTCSFGGQWTVANPCQLVYCGEGGLFLFLFLFFCFFPCFFRGYLSSEDSGIMSPSTHVIVNHRPPHVK